MCKWYCTSNGPSTNLACLNCGCRYCQACLHGEAGKMTSLIKCARCGKKPGVKSNHDRGAWSAVNNAPMNEVGGGVGDGGFTNSLRASGANESNHAAQQRTAASSGGTSSSQMRGPERFFYDKSTYTGTHTNGGPDHVAKGRGTNSDDTWKRPTSGATNSRNLAAPSTPGERTANSPARTAASPARPTRSGSKGATSSTLANAALTGAIGSARSTSKGAEGGGGSRPLRGPERFFYDKSTYTGTHTNGGPSSVAKGGGTGIDQSWKRPC